MLLFWSARVGRYRAQTDFQSIGTGSCSVAARDHASVASVCAVGAILSLAKQPKCRLSRSLCVCARRVSSRERCYVLVAAALTARACRASLATAKLGAARRRAQLASHSSRWLLPKCSQAANSTYTKPIRCESSEEYNFAFCAFTQRASAKFKPQRHRERE